MEDSYQVGAFCYKLPADVDAESVDHEGFSLCSYCASMCV